jgi:hypothetical protein
MSHRWINEEVEDAVDPLMNPFDTTSLLHESSASSTALGASSRLAASQSAISSTSGGAVGVGVGGGGVGGGGIASTGNNSLKGVCDRLVRDRLVHAEPLDAVLQDIEIVCASSQNQTGKLFAKVRGTKRPVYARVLLDQQFGLSFFFFFFFVCLLFFCSLSLSLTSSYSVFCFYYKI